MFNFFLNPYSAIATTALPAAFQKKACIYFIILKHIGKHLIARCEMALVVQVCVDFTFRAKTMTRTDPRDDDFRLTLRDLWAWNAISIYLVKYRVIGVVPWVAVHSLHLVTVQPGPYPTVS
jgi:hypothetical protein